MTYSLQLLSPTQRAVLHSVTLFRQMTTSQVRRLHYSGTAGGTKTRSQRHLRRLKDLGLLARIERPLGGYGGGSGEAIYQPVTSKARMPNAHTLDIAELCVRLVENHVMEVRNMVFDPEPWCHVQVGHMELKPDAFVEVGHYRYWCEVDLGTEFRAQLSFKMGRYVKAYGQWQDPTFPLVVWICHDEDRKRFIESVVKRQSIQGLFTVCLFDDAVSYILKEAP